MTGAMSPNMLPVWMRPLWPIFNILMRDDGGKSAAKASRSSVYTASSPELAGESSLYLNTNSKRSKWPKDSSAQHNRKEI
jgi:hypothetical protein